MANLYLFDVDGTLVDLMDFQLMTHQQAYQDVCSFRPGKEELMPRFGLVEKKIHEEILREHGKPVKDAGRIVSRRKEIFAENIGSARVRVLDGVIDFLGYLRNAGELSGVVTGNPKEAGEAILKKSGLYGQFDVYSYGDRAGSRPEIIRNAIKQAGKVGKVVVIGDTPMDIEAGKAAGAITTGIATGRFSAGELGKAKADLVLENLKEYMKIVEFVC